MERRTLLHRMFSRRQRDPRATPHIVWVEVMLAALIVAVFVLEALK